MCGAASGDKANAVQAGTATVDRKALDRHDVVDSGIDRDGVCPGTKDRSKCPTAIDRNGFGNRHGTEPARIKAVDFAASCGLGNATAKCLARSRAAARICIVTDTRHPRPKRLGLCELSREGE